MGKVIAVVNQKGGVGKTTTSVSISSMLGEAGYRVLAIDADQQGGLSSGYGIRGKDREYTLYDIFSKDASMDEVILPSRYYNVSVVSSNIALASVERDIITTIDDSEYHILKKNIEMVKDRYDYIIIDCQPSIGIVTINALVAADMILIPVQCEYYAMEGFCRLTKILELIEERLEHRFEQIGILLTMFDSRCKLCDEVEKDIRENAGYKVFKTKIPRNVRLAEAPSFEMPINVYSPRSSGAKAYREFVYELLGKE